MTTIKDIKNKKTYNILVSKTIMAYLSRMIFTPCFKIMNMNIKAKNDRNFIIDALNKGLIIYSNGYFKPQNKLPNDVSLEFKKYGAKWDKYEKGYYFDEVPDYIVNAIKELQLAQQIRINQLNGYLNDLQYNMNHFIEEMIFDNDVKRILYDANGEIKKNVKSINVIEPELNQEQIDRISENYTTNMQYYIKKWTVKNIESMRQEVQKAILEGYREDSVKKLLMNKYGIAKNKAKFLAQNETSIMLAQLKKETYTAMGFDKFIWNTILDTRERELHHELNKKVFRFDNPPVIDERTGQRGLPGETYNCRCSLTPYRDDSIFNGI